MKNILSISTILFIAIFSIFTSCKKIKHDDGIIIEPYPDKRISIIDTAKVITLSNRQGLLVTLNNPADGGYNFTNWVYDTTVLHLDTHLHTPPPQHSAPGDSGTDTWQFTTLKSGTTDLKMSVARSLVNAPYDVINLFKTTIKVQ